MLQHKSARFVFRGVDQHCSAAIFGCQSLCVIDIDDHFSSRVPFFEITNSIGNFTQAVTPVDNRRDSSLRHERCKNVQILWFSFASKLMDFWLTKRHFISSGSRRISS